MRRGWSPNFWAIVARTTAAPAAVVPPAPKRAPMSLSSVSAKKLSDGVFVSAIKVAILGERTLASIWAPGGAVPACTRLVESLTPAALSAAANCWPA